MRMVGASCTVNDNRQSFFFAIFISLHMFVVAVVSGVISIFFLKSLHYLHVAVCSLRSTFTLGTVSESSRVDLLSSQNWVGAIRVTYGALAASCLSSTEATPSFR